MLRRPNLQLERLENRQPLAGKLASANYNPLPLWPVPDSDFVSLPGLFLRLTSGNQQ